MIKTQMNFINAKILFAAWIIIVRFKDLQNWFKIIVHIVHEEAPICLNMFKHDSYKHVYLSNNIKQETIFITEWTCTRLNKTVHGRKKRVKIFTKVDHGWTWSTMVEHGQPWSD